MSNENNRYVLKSYRLPPYVIQQLSDFLILHPQKEVDFVRDAIKEKLSRTTISEDLDVKVDTLEVQRILLKNQEKFDNQLALFKDVVNSLNERLNAKLDRQVYLIENLIAKLEISHISDTVVETPKNIEQEILNMLPAKNEDIQLKFGIDETNKILNQLKEDNKVTYYHRDGVWKKNDSH